MIPGARVVTLNEIVVAVGVVIGVEHVGPHPDVDLGVHFTQHTELFGQALAQQFTHVAAAASLAGAALADLVHAEDIAGRGDGGVHAVGHIAPDLIGLWLAHADGGLAVVDGKAVKVADAQAHAVFDAAAGQNTDGRALMVEAEVQLRVHNAVVVAPFLIHRAAGVAADRDGSPGTAQDVQEADLLDPHAIDPRFASPRIGSADRDFHFVVPQAVEAPSDLAPLRGTGYTRVPRREIALVFGAHVEAERARGECPRGRQALGLGAESNAIAAVGANSHVARPNAFN